MPLRVKCRCGQELVLRFNEWVYALFGLLVLSLLVNGAALVFIATRSSGPAARTVVEKAAGFEAGEEGGAQAAEVAGRSAPASPEAASPDAPPQPAAAPTIEPRPEPPPEKEPPPAEALVPPKDAPAERVEASTVPPPAPRRVLLTDRGSPLARLLVLGRSEEPRLAALFLYDDDAHVRRAALAKVVRTAPAAVEGASRAADPASRDLLQLLLPALAQVLAEPGGRDVLRRLSGEDCGPEPRAWREWGRSVLGAGAEEGPPEAILAALRPRALALWESSTATRALEERFAKEAAGSAGVDLLIALDSTESMEEQLRELSKDAWLFGALAWSRPGVRVGILFYADEAVASVKLGSDPMTLTKALKERKAEGGGDVPEGVHEALRAALQLGRFDWRPAAEKHIVFVGDAPPPRLEAPGLLSLARECHKEAGYRIHAFSVSPVDGKKAVQYFPELAAAGGGRAVTLSAEKVAGEIFLALFAEEAREDLRRQLPLVAEAFSTRE